MLIARQELKGLQRTLPPIINHVGSALFGNLVPPPADPLLAIIDAHRRDSRSNKIDVGVGVYRDADGRTPVLQAIKTAERRLLEQQESKSYIGAAGDVRFAELLRPVIFGAAIASDRRIVGIQTPGGTGALRLAVELVRRARPDGTVHLGLPTWPVHHSVLAATGLTETTYPYFDLDTQTVQFDTMIGALAGAARGGAVLLQAACHNPTGADLDMDQWRAVAEICAARGLVPIVDIAYQGLGDGLEEDVAGARIVMGAVDEAIVTYSCDKNFGQYRDRVGAIYVKAGTPEQGRIVQDYLQLTARAMWSMPPDHGAAAVRLVLEDAALTAQWQAELAAMRGRINDVRRTLAGIDVRLAPVATQRGLFSTLPLGAERVARLASEDAIYMAVPGRINIAGLRPDQVERFGRAIVAHL